MRNTLTLAVAVAISLSTLAALEWSANRHLPQGEVTIIQIDEPAQAAPLAQSQVDGQVVRTAASSL
ncbi:MAG: hypothetical protein SXG53_24565 [Pseudomonadota bacterium]|nr:hypothetical protein [Pseudomonadota bacterium]